MVADCFFREIRLEWETHLTLSLKYAANKPNLKCVFGCVRHFLRHKLLNRGMRNKLSCSNICRIFESSYLYISMTTYQASALCSHELYTHEFYCHELSLPFFLSPHLSTMTVTRFTRMFQALHGPKPFIYFPLMTWCDSKSNQLAYKLKKINQFSSESFTELKKKRKDRQDQLLHGFCMASWCVESERWS